MQEYEQAKVPPVTPLFQRAESVKDVPESVSLSEHTRLTLRKILTRLDEATPEDTVAMSIEVLNVLTEHLARKDATVILHRPGESLRTLRIDETSGSFVKGARTLERSVYPTRLSK